MITSNEIRSKFIEFFKSKKHSLIPSAPVVPENDPTVLFTTAWMHPLVPYLLWEIHPLWKRLVNYQKCIRTWDIDEVWDNSHLTFFEMLWNWSLWDFFKKESITYSYEFLTEVLKIDKRKIAVTVFEWDDDAPRDDESAIIWQEVWIPKDKISYLPKKDNWWGPAWQTWPCWPDTEIFYWVWKSEFSPNWSNVLTDEKNWMEIWNNVFMEYLKDENGNYNLASMQNVDTWMWLERVTTILNWNKSVYDTDIFSPIIDKIFEVLDVEYNEQTKSSIRIIADHSRASTIMMSDWVIPSNVDQGYILRRLMRRAIRQAYKLGFKWQFLGEIAKVIISYFANIYPNVLERQDFILTEIDREEKQFLETLEKWLKEFEKLIDWFKTAFEKTWREIETISWKQAFKLYDTFGFPIEMTKELAEENNLKIDEEWFKKAFEEHQELSRAGAEQKFKWWLSDHSEMTTALHSATHLMLAWLRRVLWDHVHQAWSNITAERLRFDFTHPDKMTSEQLKEVEDYVNQAINENCTVILENMPKEEAKSIWVEGSFWEKYPEVVKVYTFKSQNWNVFSRELCWGPHVDKTWIMGKFKILKEEASSRGVRRIKAVLEK